MYFFWWRIFESLSESPEMSHFPSALSSRSWNGQKLCQTVLDDRTVTNVRHLAEGHADGEMLYSNFALAVGLQICTVQSFPSKLTKAVAPVVPS